MQRRNNHYLKRGNFEEIRKYVLFDLGKLYSTIVSLSRLEKYNLARGTYRLSGLIPSPFEIFHQLLFPIISPARDRSSLFLGRRQGAGKGRRAHWKHGLIASALSSGNTHSQTANISASKDWVKFLCRDFCLRDFCLSRFLSYHFQTRQTCPSQLLLARVPPWLPSSIRTDSTNEMQTQRQESIAH